MIICPRCSWVYTDHKGMGIHRAPVECPECGEHLMIRPESIARFASGLQLTDKEDDL